MQICTIYAILAVNFYACRSPEFFGMYVCVCVYVYVCICMYTHTHTHTCTYYIRVPARLPARLPPCTLLRHSDIRHTPPTPSP